VQRCPLGLAGPYPVTDAFEVFECDSVSGAFSLGNDLLGDAVVHVLGEPGLAARPLRQEALGRSRSLSVGASLAVGGSDGGPC